MLKQRHASTLPRLALAVLMAAGLLYSCALGPKPAPEAGAVPKAAAVQTPEQKQVASLEKADSLLQSGNAEAAVVSLSQLAASQPSSAELRLLKAAALASAGKIAEARAETEGVIQAEPANAKALVMAVNLARFAGDEKARRSWLDRGFSVAPADSAVLAAWGEFYADADDWKRAEDFYRRSAASDPTNPDAALGLGSSLYRLARYPEAEAALDKAIALDPGSGYAYSDRSKVRYQRGEYKEALEDLNTAIVKSPESSFLYLDRGRMEMDSGRRTEAIADFGKAIELEPDYFLPYAYRAGLYEQQGDDAGALADYTRILKLEKDYWYAYESLGAVDFRLGHYPESALAFREAYRHAPDHYEYAILTGLALLRAGKNAEAKTWAGAVAPVIDREKNGIQWLMLRLIQDQNDQTSELEIRIQTEKALDTKSAMLFYLGEYWVARGKPVLGSKYFLLSQDMRRVECLEYRLLQPEIRRLGLAESHG